MVKPPGISASPALLRRIAEQRLREQRQQQGAAEQGKAQHEHQQIRDAKGSVAKQMQIDDGIFVPPLPDNHEDQGSGANQRKRDE